MAAWHISITSQFQIITVQTKNVHMKQEVFTFLNEKYKLPTQNTSYILCQWMDYRQMLMSLSV